MRYLIHGFTVTTSILMLASCSSFSKIDCMQSNWYQQGFNGGKNGVFENKIVKLKTECHKNGIQVNEQAWLKGRTEGLKSYCNKNNFYSLGISGSDIQSVCSYLSDSELTSLKQSYMKGRNIYLANRGLEDSRNELNFQNMNFKN